MIIHDYLPHVGGAERQLAALAPLLIERGVAVTVLTRGKLGLPRRERIRGVDVHRAPLLPGKPLASLAYAAEDGRFDGEDAGEDGEERFTAVGGGRRKIARIV
jgi:hypothetical protein